MIQIPPPPQGPTWQGWAERLNSYLQRNISKLPFLRGGESAADDGIIAFDRSKSAPVVSIDGRFVELLTEDKPMDFGIQLAEAEILREYGDTVSTLRKAKSLLKFGKNTDVDSAGGSPFQTIWQIDEQHETYVTTNAIDTISSTDSADDQVIYIEGHTVTGTGANAQFTFVTQTATLNGQNKVTLGTPLARVSRLRNTNGSSLQGDVYVYEDTAISGGEPDDMTKAHISIKGTEGDQNSFKAATTFSNTDYLICTSLMLSIDKKTAAAADFEMQIMRPSEQFITVCKVGLRDNGQTSQQINFYPYVIVPKNSDVRVVAKSSSNNTELSASFQGFIAQVES